jgi:hypothetical protein
MGSAVNGPTGCTCWKAVYDQDQAAPQRDIEPVARAEMCVDCAFRPGSPERSNDPDALDEELLDDLVYSGKPFWCHQGMRRPVRYEHSSGAVVEASPLEYAPPQEGDRPYKADGRPADLCAGWMARRRHFEATRERTLASRQPAVKSK